MSELTIGEKYVLRHTRFGTATVKILADSGEWIETEVVSGKLRGMREEWWPGYKKTVRREHCFFAPIKSNP